MIDVRCKCGSLLRAKDEHAGKVLKCPKCGGRVHVPEGVDVLEELPPRSPRPEATRAGAPERRRREDDYDDEYDRPRRQRQYDDYADERPARRSGGNPLALIAMLLGLATLVVAGVLFIPAVARALGVFTFILPALLA